jgi:hypothetical protein
MRVLVCGGRDYEVEALLTKRLDKLHDVYHVSVLIEGDARGADQLAGKWAESRNITHLVFPADWKRYRAAAGPIRNKQKLEEGKPDLVVAFPGDKGTANMVQQALDAGVKVETVN